LGEIRQPIGLVDIDNLADEQIVKSRPQSRDGSNHRLVSITKLPSDNSRLLFLGARYRYIDRVYEKLSKLGDFLPYPVVDDDFILYKVEDLLLRPVALYQACRPLYKGTRPGLAADYILDIRPVGRLADNPGLHQLVVLDKLGLYHRREYGG
jgi:hypothetical protein